ncbi:MAG TPA: hypothetical protein VF576_01645, partial [Rubricoccaceae bacterium]
LGAYPCALVEGSLASRLYGGSESVLERHRHRFEVNNDLRYKLREGGMRLTGVYAEKDLVEIVELPQPAAGDGAAEGPAHPWFVGVQFHPEYRSTVSTPHPLFVGFVEASVAHAHASGQFEAPQKPSRTRKVRRASARVLDED